MQENPSAYDKGGENYDIISAFIKSIRGSDPDGVVYWLARRLMVKTKFIARRLIYIRQLKMSDWQNPNALLLANACFDAEK